MSGRCCWPLLLVTAAALGCGSRSAVHPYAPPGDVLATVNGQPLGEADVLLKLKTDTRQTELTPAARKNLLEALIEQEVLAQRGVELGLDADPAYQQKLREAQAQLAALKRRSLAELFERRSVADQVVVSDEEARAYFDKNSARLKTQVHVWQILRRSRAAIDEAQSALEKGTPFEEVVRGQFPNLPEGQSPWDLPYLARQQLPEQWLAVLDTLKKGEVSGVISGPKDRYWIIKLIDTRENEGLTFETARAALKEQLKVAKVAELEEKTRRELREQAKVVYSTGFRTLEGSTSP